MAGISSRNLKFVRWTDEGNGAVFTPSSTAGVIVARRDEFTLTPVEEMKNLFVQVMGLPHTAKWHSDTGLLTVRFDIVCTMDSHKTFGQEQEEIINLVPDPKDKKLFSASSLAGVKVTGNNCCKVARQIAFMCNSEKRTIHDTYPSDK